MIESKSRKIRIIYLDDEEMLLWVHRTYLERRGASVKTFLEPEVALKEMNDNRGSYDLALVDFRMKKKNGAQVLREMANSDFFSIPFVALFSSTPFFPDVNEAFRKLDLNKYKIHRIMKEVSNPTELPALLNEIEVSICQKQ